MSILNRKSFNKFLTILTLTQKYNLIFANSVTLVGKVSKFLIHF